MSNLIPGNQKDLAQENRVFIETLLNNNMPFKEIAKYLCKAPSTISKEIRKHRIIREHNDFSSPNQCIHRGQCHLRNVFNRAASCQKECRPCNACNRHCNRFEKETCGPFCMRLMSVGSPKRAQCRQERYFYKAVTADRHYHTVLSQSRVGINISEPNMEWLDSLVTPLIRHGQTPYMILNAHPEIKSSVKTLYNYIDSGALSVKNIDLPRKVIYKLRRPHPSFMTEYPDTNVVKMDMVVGCEGSHKVFLPLYFHCCKLMIIYLLPDKTFENSFASLTELERHIIFICFGIYIPL